MVEFRVRGVKADLSKLAIKQLAAYFMLRAIEPTYIKLRNILQTELNRIANLEAIARGQELFEKLQEKKKSVTAFKEIERQGQQANSQIDYDAVRIKGCRHLKGGRRLQNFTLVKDYAVNHHRFIDGSVRIKCTLCPKVWYPADADWNEAVKMLESSTNTPSSSEIPYTKNDVARMPGRYNLATFIYNSYNDMLKEKRKEDGPNSLPQ